MNTGEESMENAPQGIYFYALFKTTCPDGSAYWGITKTQNPSYGEDGQPVSYYGNGPRLRAKARQFGIQTLRHEVLEISPDLAHIQKRLNHILNPETLADPRCLNESQAAINEKIAQALTGTTKTDQHKEKIAHAMVGNQNAVKPDEVKPVPTQDTQDPVMLAAHRSDKQSQPQSQDQSQDALRDHAGVWYHKVETAEEIMLEHDELPLTGFVKGRLPKELKKKFNRNKKVVMSDADRARLIPD